MQSSLSDSGGPSAMVAATEWVQDLLLGSLPATLAVLGIASIGLMMLAGRINVRRGATVVVGCFIVFAAPRIAAGIRATIDGTTNAPVLAAAPEPPPVVIPPNLPGQPHPPGYDPYAGASAPH